MIAKDSKINQESKIKHMFIIQEAKFKIFKA